MARVSILVPCFNAERWIDAALESALAQQRDVACEIIAVDDGSTDGTRDRLEPYRRRRVTVIHQPNRGASAARNAALAAATGDFVQYLDADDVLGDGKIATQLQRLSTAEPNVVSSCEWGRFTERVADARFVPEPVWRDMSAIEFLVTCAFEELMFPPAAWLIPRGVCEAAGPWDETISLNDDGEYMARVLACSNGIVFCPGAQVFYRSGNPLSYGSRKSQVAAESELRAWHSIVQTMKRLDDSPRVDAAAATGYQRIQASHFMVHDEIASEAARLAAEFGGGQYEFKGGRLFRAAVHVFGWKTAMRVRRARESARSRSAAQ